jgi:hypothetical protein
MAYYVWEAASERFVLDPRRSEITERDIVSLSNGEMPAPRDFIEINHNELMAIAKGKDKAQKDWLKSFLATVEDGPRKAALRQALEFSDRAQ